MWLSNTVSGAVSTVSRIDGDLLRPYYSRDCMQLQVGSSINTAAARALNDNTADIFWAVYLEARVFRIERFEVPFASCETQLPENNLTFVVSNHIATVMYGATRF